MTVNAAVEALYHDKVDVDHYVTKILPLEKIFDGFRLLGIDPETGQETNRIAMKILIKP